MAENHTALNCPQVGKIKVLEEIVSRLDHLLNGNGQEGMAKTFVRLETNFTQMGKTMEEIRTNQDELFCKVDQVLTYKIGKEAVEKTQEIRKIHVRWLIGSCLVLCSIIIALLAYLNNVKRYEKEVNTKQTPANSILNEDKSTDNLSRNYVYNQ